MESVKEKIVKSIEEVLTRIIGPSRLGLAEAEALEIKLEHPEEEKFGDYSANIALISFAKHKTKSTKQKFSSPMELAEEIVKQLQKESANLNTAKIEAIKPGFINFTLSPKVFSNELSLALKENEQYGRMSANSKDSDNKKSSRAQKTMLLDHSHPNIAKRFGIGHLRSTIIGQALIRMYRFIGWNVIADNFLGDWGTQFGSLIVAIKERQAKSDKRKEVEELTIDDLEKMYVDFNKRAKEDPKLWEEAQKAFKRLEDGSLEEREIWEKVKKISMVEFEKIWKLLGTKFDHIHAESFFEDKMAKVLKDAEEKGISEKSEGALIVRIPGSETPLLLLKSDGATTYETRDLAAIVFWVKEFNPDVIAYEVGSEQALHFEQVFKVAEMLGYISCDKLVHIQHGLYLGKDGKKMRTRTGDTIKLEEVLDEAVRRAKKLGEIRAVGAVREDEELAQAVGIGAIKYFDLSHQPATNIVFDWEKAFQMDGNSAPYLQYTYARTQSILAKAIVDDQWLMNNQSSIINHQSLSSEELSVLRHFYKFGNVVQEGAEKYSPNLLCNFLFELAQRYNTFYAKHRVVGEVGAVRDFRLALTQVTGNILKSGLNLLGISAPERM